MIERRLKPRARRVPISRARAATCAYIVFAAAKQAPIAISTANTLPRMMNWPDDVSDWSS